MHTFMYVYTYILYALCSISERNTLQHITILCNTLQQHTTYQKYHIRHESPYTQLHTSLYRNTPQHTATHRNTPQHTATLRNTLHHTAHTTTHCNTLQHTATHCNNTLQQHTTYQGYHSRHVSRDTRSWPPSFSKKKIT